MSPGSRLRGFTFPEALVTIGVVILFASVAGGLYFQGRSLSERQDRESRLLREKASLATVLPALCQSVRPPEWESSPAVFDESAGVLTAGYWNGDPKAVVTFQVADGVFEVKSPEISQRWTSLDSVSVGWWKNGDRVVGLTVEWKEAGEGKTLRLAWGSRPL